MLSDRQANAERTPSPSDPTQSSSSGAAIPHHVDEASASLEAMRLTTDQIRETVRLLQCPSCSNVIIDPVTLPCGNTICKHCIPETYFRPYVTYPANEGRQQGFECPFSECKKEHAIDDCSPDVLLNKVLTDAKTAIEAHKQDEQAKQHSVTITVRSSWAVSGISRGKNGQDLNEPQVITGGRFLATYTLVESGVLDYFAEVEYDMEDRKSADAYDLTVVTDVKNKVRPEVDCHICYAMLYDPLTTGCGHTFCRHCLQRVLDHAAHCPVCRRTLSMPSVDRETCPPNSLLKRYTTAFWADDLAARKETVAAENSFPASSEYDSAVFVLALAFPLMPTFLHVFEPRYRLMIRRALEANRQFGMVLHHRASFFSGPTISEMGTMLHIENVEFFPDGRSLIETVGVGRFRMTRTGMLDGYMVAQTERINDISIAEEEELEARETSAAVIPGDTPTTASASSAIEPVQPPLQPQISAASSTDAERRMLRIEDFETMPTSQLMEYAVEFVTRMEQQSVGWLTSRILAIYGNCPEDPATFPWWFASILPVRDEEKQRLLGTTSVRQRLKLCCRWILEWETSRWSLPTNCTMM